MLPQPQSLTWFSLALSHPILSHTLTPSHPNFLTQIALQNILVPSWKSPFSQQEQD
jgi:hypothetical protein